MCEANRRHDNPICWRNGQICIYSLLCENAIYSQALRHAILLSGEKEGIDPVHAALMYVVNHKSDFESQLQTHIDAINDITYALSGDSDDTKH